MAQLVDQWHRARRAPDGSLVPTDRYGRGRRWAVRYRDPSGRQRTESFDRKSDAVRCLGEISHTIMRGFWVDPALGRTRTGDWLTDWLAANEGRWRATTAAKRRQLVRDWYTPSFGDVPIGNLRTSMVQSAVSGWQAVHAAGTVAHALTVLRQALDATVDDGLIARNPAARVQRRPSRRRREVYLGDTEVAAILAACHDDDRPFLLYLALAGPRLDEALALHADDLDMAEQTARIWRQVDTSTAERRYFPLKGAARMGDLTRTVPLADALRDSIERLLDPRHCGQGRQPSGPVFLTRRGLPYSRGSVDALVERTARAAGVVFSPRALRHYFGASLISRGVPVTQVAGWMGHSSPRTTLNVYAYCMPRDDETGRAALRDTASTIIPDVRPMCASDDRAEPG